MQKIEAIFLPLYDVNACDFLCDIRSFSFLLTRKFKIIIVNSLWEADVSRECVSFCESEAGFAGACRRIIDWLEYCRSLFINPATQGWRKVL